MAVLVTTAAIALVVGATGGAVAAWKIRDNKADRDELILKAESAAAVADALVAGSDLVAAAGQGTEAALGTALAPATTEAMTRKAIAESDVAGIAVHGALSEAPRPENYALAAYALCLQAAQAKGEGSTAFGCTARGTTLDDILLSETHTCDNGEK